MSDLSIKYKNNEIATLSSSGTKTIKTKGKYCEDNITVVYDRPNGLDTSDATATINDLLFGKTAYVNGEKITGILPIDYLSGNLSIEKGTITSGSDGYAYINLENKPLFMFFTDYCIVSGLTSYAGFDARNGVSFHSSLAVNGISTLVQIGINISDNNVQVLLLDNNSRNPIPNKELSYISIYDGIQTYNTEEKIVTPTESVQEITPTSADGLSKVIVNAIPSNYIGSNIIINKYYVVDSKPSSVNGYNEGDLILVKG